MIKLYSDGGSDLSGHAGAATIVVVDDKIYCFGAYLGDATNNEGEIFAMLMGFAMISELGFTEKTQLEWISDSQYALKSASQYIHNWVKNGWKTSQKDPVKNQGLWRTFLNLSKGVSFIPIHVKGHSGHSENEACDSAVSWLREYHGCLKEDVFLSANAVTKFTPYENWLFINGSNLLKTIRENDLFGLSKDTFLKALNVRSILQSPSTISRSLPDDDPEIFFKKISQTYLSDLKKKLSSTSDRSLDPNLIKAISHLEKYLG